MVDSFLLPILIDYRSSTRSFLNTRGVNWTHRDNIDRRREIHHSVSTKSSFQGEGRAIDETTHQTLRDNPRSVQPPGRSLWTWWGWKNSTGPRICPQALAKQNVRT